MVCPTPQQEDSTIVSSQRKKNLADPSKADSWERETKPGKSETRETDNWFIQDSSGHKLRVVSGQDADELPLVAVGKSLQKLKVDFSVRVYIILP